MLFFLDIETTGLDPISDAILEVACTAVDGSLVEVDHFETLIQPIGAYKALMDAFVYDMHTDNGLLSDLQKRKGLFIGEAEKALIGFIEEHSEEKARIAGFSIHFDRSFLEAQMPALCNSLSHRMLDVSSIRYMVQTHWPDLVPARNAEVAHRALADAREAHQTYANYVKYLNPRRWGAR